MHTEKEKEGGIIQQVKNDENSNGPSSSKPKVWDCGSTLYDSFELNCFKRQLDSAIANSSRSLSMPHLSDRRMPAPAPSTSANSVKKAKAFNNISRSLQKLVRSVFKANGGGNNNNMSRCSSRSSEKSRDGSYYVVYEYDKSESGPLLTTIPEVPDFEIASLSLSPDLTSSSFVKTSASLRLPSTSLGISCA